MAYAECIAEFTHAASQSCDLTVGPTVAALQGYPPIQRPLSSFGNNINYAADGLRAVKSSTGAAEDFDALDAFGREIGEIVSTGGGAVDFNAVDQNQHLIRRRATNKDRS